MSIIDDDEGATINGGTTDQALIGNVANWGDDSAWGRFDSTYRPMIRRWGQGLGFRGDDLEELCQVVMVDVLKRAKSFRYDPSRSFRGWLRRVVHSRAVELIRTRQRQAQPLGDADARIGGAQRSRPDADTPASPGSDDRLHDLAAEVQQAVRGRVDPENWRIFWMIRVEGQPIAEVAQAVGKTYAATYRNQQRIARMLQDEADRRLSLAPTNPPA